MNIGKWIIVEKETEKLAMYYYFESREAAVDKINELPEKLRQKYTTANITLAIA